MNPARALVVELIVAAPIDVVWTALRDRTAIAQWFGWNHPDLPAEIDYIFFDADAKADEATHRLTIGDDEFALERRGNETLVRVTRAAPASGSWDDIYDEITEGWRTFAYQLQYTLGQHPHETRRTTYLSGRVRSVGGARPPEALGVDAIGDAGDGSEYAFETAVGDRLTGRVWFRSAWQIGLVVNDFGPGLLVAMRRPATDKSPYGGVMFVLSLYGFDQPAHEALTRRWQSWFESQFDNVTMQT